MMSDRFTSQLRQHLLVTADDRPADGQLAAIAERVAVTAQRSSLVARVTWLPTRIGPIPTRTLRYGLIAAALIAATVAAALVVGALLRQPSTAFEGTWISIDPADHSTQTLAVSEGPEPVVRFVDDYATGEACLADAIKIFTANGQGTIDGDRLTVVFPDGGGCGLRSVDIGPGIYAYDQTTDAIVDEQQLTWRRVQGATGLPTPNPLTTTPRPAKPTEAPWCSDIPPGGTYSSDVRGLSLTVTIPVAARFEWQGTRDGFNVAGHCFFGGVVGMEASIVTTVAGACDANAWADVSTPAEAVAALTRAPGIALSQPTRVTLGGHPATRFELASDAQLCFDEVLLWGDVNVSRGTPAILYIVDVDGRPLGITIANRRGEGSPANVAEAEAILGSLQASAVPGAHPSSAPVTRPGAECVQFDGTGTYTAPVGRLSISATLPDQSGTYWHGNKDSFFLVRSPCLYDAPLSIEGSLVTEIPIDACAWDRPGTRVANAAAVAAALADQAGTDVIGHSELTINGHAAARVLLHVPDDVDPTNCSGGQLGLWAISDGDAAVIDPGATTTVYLVDVDGSILGMQEMHDTGDDGQTATLLREIDQIIASLRIEP